MVRNREGAVESKEAGRFRFGKRAGRRCCISMLSSATRYRLRRKRPDLVGSELSRAVRRRLRFSQNAWGLTA